MRIPPGVYLRVVGVAISACAVPLVASCSSPAVPPREQGSGPIDAGQSAKAASDAGTPSNDDGVPWPDGGSSAASDAAALDIGPSDVALPGCVAATCAALGFDCGVAADGCGRLLSCGSCASPAFCGGKGANHCGGDVTRPTSDASVEAVAIAAGEYSTCALLSNGTAKCWGYNMYGQLGDGTFNDSATPVAVQGLAGATAIGGWDGYHVCAVLSSGHAQCWGSGLYGSLGNGGGSDSTAIKDVANLSNARTISTGSNNTCAAAIDGTAWCWGEEPLFDGQDYTAPAQAPGLMGVADIVAAWDNTSVLLANGTVAGVGSNVSGEIGDGVVDFNATHVVSMFTPVSGLSQVTAIAAGVSDECALLSDGTVRCWGDDTHGQIGAGVTMPGNAPPYGDSTPVPVTGLSGATAIAVGGSYACALLSDGTVDCWGDNEDGCLGNGTIVDSNVPVAVSGLSHAVAISTAIEHACALIDDGSVECWGWNNMGQLGSPQGTTTCTGEVCSMTPTPVIWGSP